MIRRLFEWLFPFLKVQTLLLRAGAHGRVTLQETELATKLGWTCSIRPPRDAKGHAVRYAWTGTGDSLEDAIEIAVGEADGSPIMAKLDGIPFAPKLGGKEFDG